MLHQEGWGGCFLSINATSGAGGRGMAKEKFEDSLNKLEKIVSKLEEGEIPLEESLRLFEEGIRLSRLCSQKLDEAEKRVEVLLRGKEEALSPQPFDPSIPPRRDSGQAPSIPPQRDSGQVPSTGSRQAPSTENAEIELDSEE
jgi:exodeoxyribonuclease VII small subunit